MTPEEVYTKFGPAQKVFKRSDAITLLLVGTAWRVRAAGYGWG